MDVGKISQGVIDTGGAVYKVLFLNWFATLVNDLDIWVKQKDWQIYQIYPEKSHWFQVPGHPRFISVLALLLLIFLVQGPTLGYRGVAGYSLMAAGLALLVWLFKTRARANNLVWIQLGVMLAVTVAAFCLLSQKEDLERGDELYRHIFIPLFWVVAVAIMVNRVSAHYLFRHFANDFAAELKKTELFYTAGDRTIPIHPTAPVRAFFTSLLYFPHYIVLLAAFAAITVADFEQMRLYVFGLLALGFVLMIIAETHERLLAIRTIVHGMFFTGGQLVISIFVIALGIGRFLDISYIRTLIEIDDNAANWIIVLYVTAAYILFWFYEYWNNRIVNEHVLLSFRDKADGSYQGGRIRYAINENARHSGVDKDGRLLQLHGGARFAVKGVRAGKEDYRAYSRAHLIDTILDHSRYTAVQDDPDAIRLLNSTNMLRQRIRFYFAASNLVLIAILAAAMYYAFAMPKRAELQVVPVTEQQKSALFDLQEQLFAGEREQAIAIAASGGGTRAALYTESVLNGLSEIGVKDDVLLASGVSGGSATLAYFAMYRDKLADPEQRAEFLRIMSKPFIQDVLEGVIEWRISFGRVFSNEETGFGEHRLKVRLGNLLAESFAQHFHSNTSQVKTIGEQRQVGLIFNTTLTGSFPRWSFQELGGDSNTTSMNPWQDCAYSGASLLAIRESTSPCEMLRTNLTEGSRLVFTNLKHAEAFPHEGIDNAPTEYLNYKVIQSPGVQLSHAAALSANFPPVFSNAAVNYGNDVRYWVTDGGATENRGALSLLYALQHAVKLEKQRPDNDGRARPRIVIIIAEASATAFSYKQNRGVSAKLSASAQIASQLIKENVDKLKQAYKDIGGTVTLKYLAMPVVLRSNGGLGTHWMLPTSVKYRRSLQLENIGSNGFNADEVVLDKQQTLGLIRSLHYTGTTPISLDSDTSKVIPWICEDQFSRHQQLWRETVNELKPGNGYAFIGVCDQQAR